MKLKLLLLLGSSCMALLLGEAVLRLAVPDHYYVWPPHLKQIFKPDPRVMPGISGESRFEINSLGLRGDELTPAHTYRILTIGGSTTECLYLDQSETWPSLLQKMLNENAKGRNVWVGNAGMSGRATRHHLVAMEYLPLKEMKIDAIVLLVGLNDFHGYIDNSEFLAKSDNRDELLYETFKGGMRHSQPDDPFFKKTATWRLVRSIKDDMVQKVDQNKVQDEFGGTLETWREHRRQATEIRNELPDLTPGLNDYIRHIEQIIDVAQRQQVSVILMTQPTMWKPGLSPELTSLLWLGGIGDFQSEGGKPYYSIEALDAGMKKYNDALLSVCQRRRVDCIDLSGMPKDTTMFYDDVHFNESGAQQVASILASHMLRQPPFADAPR